MDGIVTDQERLDSAHKLFGRSAESTLSAIDSVPNPADQSDPSTRNVRGVDDPAKWVIPQVDVAPPGDMPPKPKGPAFLDQIPDAAAALRQPSAAPPAAPPAFLSDIPDAASPLQQAHAEASVFDATHSAIVRRLANQFGQPPEFIDKNISQAKAQAAAPTPSFFQMMEQNYPGSTKFYAQPENMAVAHDDMPNTVQHEAAVQVGGQSISLWDLFKTGAGRSALGDIATGGKQDQVPQDLDSVQRLALGAGQILPDLPVMALGGAVTAPLGAAAGGPAGALVAAGAGAMGTPAAVHEVLKEYRSGEIKSVPDLVRAFIRVEKSVGKSMLVGGVAAAGGVLAGPQGALAALATENALLTVGGKAAEGELKNANDVMQYATSPEAARDYTDNLLLGLGLHGVTHLTAADAKKVAVTQDQRVKQQFYDAIGQTAEASKLRERLPDVHSDFVDGLVKGGPMQDVYLPVDAATSYFQKNGIDIEDVADGLGVRDSLAEARATGGDIKIPLAKWLEKMVGTEHYKALREDIKFSPEDLSPRQSAEIESETRARVQDAADQALKDAEIPEDADQDGKIEAAQKVYQDMQEKLTAAGLSGAEVKHNPTLFREFFSTLADRINESAPDDQKVDALDLQQRFNVDVNKFETPAERDAVRGRQGAMASQSQFNQSAPERLARAKSLGFDTERTLYHGTYADIDQFKIGKKVMNGRALGDGVYLTSDPAAASEYASPSRSSVARMGGNVMPVFAKIENPFHLEEKVDSAFRDKLLSDKKLKSIWPKIESAKDNFDLYSLLRNKKGYDITGGLKDAGYDGVEAPHMKTTVVFDPKNIRSVNAQFENAESAHVLHQGDENNPRGQISFAGRQFNIDLFKEKDVSTFLHETGHYFLEVMGHVVEGEGAGSEGLQKDYATILKYLGVNERGEIGSEQHEKFARAFETYLSEGKAPSEGLRQAFSQFRRWLTDLWRKVSFAKVEVSPELRDVFDRMLGAEDGVSEARRSLDMEKEFNLDGVDEKTKSEIETLRERARSRAEETLLKERLKETKSEYRDHLAEERAKFRAVAEDQVREEPLFKAIDQLQEQMSGRDPYGVAEAALRGELTPEDSTEFQMLADEHGFTTAQEMAEKISEAGATNLFDTKVSDMTEEALRNVGAIKDPAALREEALKAVHSEDAEQLMALEREALIDLAAKRVASVERRAQNRAQAKLEIQAAKGEAQMILSKMPAEEAGRPQRFITQERNAAARVARFVARKDFEKAAEAKQQQLVAHALVRESFRINEEMEKHLKYIRQFMGRRGSLLDMPFGFVRQLDVMLDRFGFQTMPKEDEKTLQTIATGMAQEGQSAHDIANATGYVEDAQGRLQPESLAQFVERQNENYHAMEFPPEVMGAIRRDSKDLTLDELRAVRETMQTIAEGGRKHDRFLNEFIKVDIKEAAMKFRQKVESTFGKPYEEQLLPGQTEQGKLADLLDTLQHFPDALNRTLDTVLTTCHKFDGLEEGPAKEFIYRPMAEAEARKTTRMRESMAEMEAIFAKHYDESEFAKYKDTEIAQNGRKYTKEQILSMALNWGNGGNRQRLFSMPGLDEAAVRNLFSNLTKKDWDFAQDTWDHIDKYWPEIKKLEMAVNGVEPSKVEALKFNNEHGEYKGGYYPIAYDFEKSADAFQHNQTKDALFKQYSTAKAATAQGHTQARVARVTRPLRLSLDVLANHHEDIIHDLEFRRAVIDINRFLGERDTKTAITNAVGVRGYGAMQDWLKSVAGGNSEPLTAWDRAAQWFRFKTTFFNLGYRLTSAPKIAIENAVNTASEIGWSGTARAIKNYYLGDGSHEMVIEKSPFMRERASHLDRDMGDLIDKQRGEGQGAFQKYAFFVHSYLDRGMSFPLWADTYRRSLAEGAAERLAVHQADESVKRTFMTGGRVDQASFARGSELKKAMTVAYGYQSMMWNRFSRQRFQASMEWNNGNHLQAAATMAMSTVYTFAFPAAVAALTREFLRNGPASSGQDEKKRMLISALEEATPLKFVPLARDLNVYALRKASGEHVGDLQLAPLEGMMQTLINPVAEAASGKHSQRFPEESAGALSFMFGIPRQVNDVAFNFLDWQHGNGALTWRDALGRRHKK